ncbi:MAG: divalent-cation tolerance protein CutA [Candidatus Omnitrophica bacterium]|nr:divalent-cation tolerance protein CutA [Candidatus Omnitrophota bacterium]MDE2222434.1 divalent-cation tolerance protein CutA [Candidatus Omnitrophota bacterium]
MSVKFITVLVTAKDTEEAEKIARGVLNDKLAACANILGGVRSLYWWQGQIDASQEVLLVLKTKEDLFEKIVSRVKSLHSYQTPEIIALSIVHGSGDYLNWINSSCA